MKHSEETKKMRNVHIRRKHRERTNAAFLLIPSLHIINLEQSCESLSVNNSALCVLIYERKGNASRDNVLSNHVEFRSMDV
jgi:hypothetical protein